MNRLWCMGVLLLSFLFPILMNAQQVIYSPYEKFDLRTGDFSIIGKTGSRIYTYRASSDGFFLDAYNDSMEKMATVMLDFFPKKIYETRFVSFPDKIVVLYQSVESGKVVQYAALLDDKGRLLKGPLQLTSVKTGIFGPTRDYLSSAVSDDKKQVLVYGIEQKGEELLFSGVWIDDQLGVLHRSSASFKSDNDLSHGEGILDNSGNFYLPAFTPVGAQSYADQLWLLSLRKGSRRFYSREFPLNDQYAANTYMKLDNANNRIYAGGFYSDKKNGNYEGALYGYYDISDSSWHNKQALPFDESIRNAAAKRNEKKAFNNYQVKQMIIKKDGGFVLIAEDFYLTTRTSNAAWGGYYSPYNGPFSTPSVREYNYGDILTLSYDAAGKRDWYAFIRKSQYSQEDGGVFSSYALVNTGGSLGFLYNDFNTRTSKIQFSTVDATGKVDIRSLSSGNANDPDWLPRSGKQISLREVVVPSISRRQISFAKVIF
jgi:hypothetical protein